MADWYPNSRDGQLHLVKTWLAVFSTKAAPWNIPPAALTQLQTDCAEADAVLAVVKSGARTGESVVRCNLAFKAMETEARFIRRHYLLLPPLDLADLPTLLLPLPDETHSPVGVPAGQPGITVSYPGGPHVLAAHLGPLPGAEAAGGGASLPGRGDYGYALYLGLMPPGGASLEQAAGPKHYLMKPPLSGDELLHLRFTRRKKETVTFDAAESAMTAYFCARYENQKGEHGAWGPVVSAVIP
jgi:hypothetical protein